MPRWRLMSGMRSPLELKALLEVVQQDDSARGVPQAIQEVEGGEAELPVGVHG